MYLNKSIKVLEFYRQPRVQRFRLIIGKTNLAKLNECFITALTYSICPDCSNYVQIV